MEKDSVIDRFVNQVIHVLYELGFFESKPTKIGWYLKRDKRRLKKEGFRAATSMDGENPIIILPEDFQIEKDFGDLIHEIIHLSQVAKGDLKLGYGDGTSFWKGKKYNNLPYHHENYFENQPWEKEAEMIFPDLIKKMQELSSRNNH